MGNLHPWLEANLVCPRADRSALSVASGQLICGEGHTYPIVDDVPIMLLDDAEQTHEVATRTFRSIEAGSVSNSSTVQTRPPGAIHPLVQDLVQDTCGILYRPLIGKLTEYPIPAFRLPNGHGATLLDAGCHWGRWSIAAARAGYFVVGIDPSLEAVLAARCIIEELGLSAIYLVADARYIPLRDGCIDTFYSYGVLQHLSKENVRLVLSEAARVVHEGGTSVVQMPNSYGVRQLYHQAKSTTRRRLMGSVTPYTGRWSATSSSSDQSGISESIPNFEVRYWSPREILDTFSGTLGPSNLSIDGFFGLGVGSANRELLLPRYRAVVKVSDMLRRLEGAVPFVKRLADSVYVWSKVDKRKNSSEPTGV